MVITLKSKWYFALLAGLLYVTAPLVDAVYYMIEDGRSAYPSNADSIGIPIYFFAMALLYASPLYAAVIWLATRSYRGGRSLLAFDTSKPIWSAFWSLLLGGLVLYNLYDAICKADRILPVEVASDLAWSYLLLCLRSSLAGGAEQPARRQAA